jgi:hypothetical protein
MGARRIMMRLFRGAKPQTQLFKEEVPAVPVRAQLPLTVQEQLAEALKQWMQVLAKRIQEEVGDDNE